MLDLPVGASWTDRIEQESANADAFIFLLGAGTSVDSHLQSEWQALLRSDWDAKKPMIPVLLPDWGLSVLPKFLANRHPLVTRTLTG